MKFYTNVINKKYNLCSFFLFISKNNIYIDKSIMGTSRKESQQNTSNIAYHYYETFWELGREIKVNLEDK
jgi:hypothetical protein